MLFFKKSKYVLKAKAPSGVWEDVEVYEKPLSYAELSDRVEELRDEGYTYVRFEERRKDDDKIVRVLWSRKFSDGGKNSDDLNLEKIKKYADTLKTLKEVLGIKEYSPEDVIANALYYKNLLEELAQYGKSENKSEIKEILELLTTLRQLQVPNFAPAQPSPSPAPAPAPNPQNITITQNLPPEIEGKVNELLDKVAEKTQSDVDKVFTPPCMKKGTCKESEKPPEEEIEEEIKEEVEEE